MKGSVVRALVVGAVVGRPLPLLVVANEISGTTTIYAIERTRS